MIGTNPADLTLVRSMYQFPLVVKIRFQRENWAADHCQICVSGIAQRGLAMAIPEIGSLLSVSVAWTFRREGAAGAAPYFL